MARIRQLLGISVFWLALSMLFDGLTTVVLPYQVLTISGGASKATSLGLLTFAGLLLAMLVQPIAGALSDQLRQRWGRRPFIALAVLLLLPALAGLGMATSLLGLLVAYLLLMSLSSAAQAAQQGFIPDLVPDRLKGTAAGLKGLLDLSGAMLGFVVLGQLLETGQVQRALVILAVVLVSTSLLTLVLVREPRQPGAPPARRPGLRAAFSIDFQGRQTFVWLVVARFCFLLGTYAVGRFLLFFVAERLRLDPEQAAEQAGMLLGGLALLTGLASPLAGWAADRLRRSTLMIAGALLSGLGALGLILAADALQIFLAGGLMALGSGMFTTANWARTSELVPGAEAARYMGLANVGTAGAAAAAGLFGLLVDGANMLAAGAGYPALFVAASLTFIASAFAVRRSEAPAPGPLLATTEEARGPAAQS